MHEASNSGGFGTPRVGEGQKHKGADNTVLSLIKFNELLEAEKKGKLRRGDEGE